MASNGKVNQKEQENGTDFSEIPWDVLYKFQNIIKYHSTILCNQNSRKLSSSRTMSASLKWLSH
jgi:hypothetical protein